eukprot:CAMPEP_0176295020 /NCGR_PEP_ID=MMETSP0121_2-20121125/57448_1 /TAXON_ID=160619 /ORGANISM="Kryptoperidinium foliaceum, Strain CCMP 1326" /LENGTH=56 /DNA_ID=CAMNT_0017636079 /DNA_START=27 /DNA_END=197 /DNA_ORIENTATION=+
MPRRGGAPVVFQDRRDCHAAEGKGTRTLRASIAAAQPQERCMFCMAGGLRSSRPSH